MRHTQHSTPYDRRPRCPACTFLALLVSYKRKYTTSSLCPSTISREWPRPLARNTCMFGTLAQLLFFSLAISALLRGERWGKRRCKNKIASRVTRYAVSAGRGIMNYFVRKRERGPEGLYGTESLGRGGGDAPSSVLNAEIRETCSASCVFRTPYSVHRA